MAGETDRDYTFEADAVGSSVANFSAFDQIERAQAHQNAVLSSPVYSPRTHSGYFEEHPGDLWSGHSVRSLAAHYGSDEANNQEYFWGVRFQVPTSVNPIRDNLIWELHHPYTPGDPSQHMDFGNAIAPFALHIRRGDLPITYGSVAPTTGMVLCWRTACGDQPFAGGNPTALFQPNMALCHITYGTWIAVLVHIKFKQDNTGVIEVWANNSGTIDDTFGNGPPQYSKYNFTSHFWNSSRGVNNPLLYFLLGLYKGGGNTDKQDIIIFDGCVRRGGRATPTLNKAAAVAWLVGDAEPPPGTGGGGGGTWITTAEADQIRANITDASKPHVLAARNNIVNAANLNATWSPPSPNGNYAQDAPASPNWRDDLYLPGLADGHEVLKLAQAYICTLDPAYATKARQGINAWRNTYTHPPGVPPGQGTAAGHAVAEPQGWGMKFAIAINMLTAYYEANFVSELAAIRTWLTPFLTAAKTTADNIRLGVVAGTTMTVNGQNLDYYKWGNSHAGQRAWAVTLAGAIGGSTLTSTLAWNLAHTAGASSDSGWDAYITGLIIASAHTTITTPTSTHAGSAPIGETSEGHGRESIGYGLFAWGDLAIIAHIAKRDPAGSTDLFTRNVVVSTSGGPVNMSLLSVVEFYKTYLQTSNNAAGEAFYGTAETQLNDVNREYRAIWELIPPNVAAGNPFMADVLATLNTGGASVRGGNHDDHTLGYNAIMSNPEFVPGTGGGGDPEVEPDGWLGGPYEISTRPSQFGSQENKQRCFKMTVANTGTVTHIGFYGEPNTGSSGVEQKVFAVWPDNGTGTDPGASPQLGQTVPVSFTNVSPTGRISTPLIAPFAVAADDIVWIGELTGGQPNVMMSRQGAPGAFRLMDQPFTSGVGAWNSTIDSAFSLDYTLWLEGTVTAGVVPTNIAAPTITGTARPGQTLTLTNTGQWTTGSLTFTRQWQRDNGALSYANIAGATAATYVVTNADVGARIRCVVTGTNANGSGVGNSNALGPVTALAVRVAEAGHSVVAREVRAGRRAGGGGGG